MPSSWHDAANKHFRDHPPLIVMLLRQRGLDLPDSAPVVLESNDLNDRISKDLRPDTVFRLGPPQARSMV